MMDDTTTMLRDAVSRLLKDHVTAHRTMELERAGIDAALWTRFAEMGLRGDGTGLGLDARMAVLQETGRAGALLPYAESEVLGRLLAEGAGLELGDATLTVMPGDVRAETLAGGGARLYLPGAPIPWGRHASHVLVRCVVGGQACVAAIEGPSLEWQAQANMAGEPRDGVLAASVVVPSSALHPLRELLDADWLQRTGALCRAASMVGALGTALELAIQYAQDRKQFGKPLSQFQVIQSYLAEMAAETCAAAVALDLATAGAVSGDGWGDVAVAKVRAGQAANTVARLAHQVHGAIGMTREYPLNVWTRRLWSWREEFGNESYWSGVLGRSVIDEGEGAFWPRMAGSTLPLATERRA